jgi:4-amino-4-deoxy-L-arabinose transferase-like glycosyltransferase
LLLAAVAVALSILASVYTRPEPLRYDEKYYVPLATGIAAGHYQDGYIVRPPLYPLFLAAIIRVFGEAVRPALMVQSVIRGILIILVCLAGKRLFSTTTGLIAGGLLTIYPLLIWMNTRLLNEAIYVPLFVLSFYALDRAVIDERPKTTFVAGLTAGLASLARATSFFLTLIIAVWLLARRSSAGRFSSRNAVNAFVLIIGMFVAISPWTIRNAVVHKAFMPLGNEPSYNLWFIVSGTDLTHATEEWNSWGSQFDRQVQGLSRWWRYVRDHPGFHFERLARRLPRVFDPVRQRSAMGLSAVVRGVGSRVDPGLTAVLGLLVPSVFVVLLVGGLLGIGTISKPRARRDLFVIVVLYFILVHAATVMKARYFLPLVCLLSLPAANLIMLGLKRLGTIAASRRPPPG